MSYASTHTVGVIGVEGHVISVQTHLSMGLPAFVVVGLPDTSVKESKDRLRAAMSSSGLSYPQGKNTVNLHPAELPKSGSGFDLAIAAAILKAQHNSKTSKDRTTIYLGELGLDGYVYPVKGALAAVLSAKKQGFTTVVVAQRNEKELSILDDMSIVPVGTLHDLMAWLDIPVDKEMPHYPPASTLSYRSSDDDDHTTRSAFIADMGDVIGQYEAKKAIEIAAAGGHHVYLHGDPGCGKTLLARCLPGILPPLTKEQAIEVTAIHSMKALADPSPSLIRQPPFVHPHYSTTLAAMIGGGSGIPRPGAVTLAHHGVLFLDEAPEFPRTILESLRLPLEHGSLTLHRARVSARFPARFQLVLAANPCPCSQAASSQRMCQCRPHQKIRYAQKISGPILDRIDISCYMRTIKTTTAELGGIHERSSTVQQRVIEARQRALLRWQELGVECNRDIPSSALRCGPAALLPAVRAIVDEQIRKGVISMRGADKIVRLSWTIADLAGHQQPEDSDLLQAIAFYSKEER
ncbi:MAG: YifB family Mg chelatase-like AAA ATPase [Actinomycetaceae bacterium]|nr:YifB family Mg chelatase-like AAA ATPase [Actinomycetaceae bacterium]